MGADAQKATLVVFWEFANESAETDDGEDTPKAGSRLLFTRGYSVFNAAQVDGYTPKADADTPIEQRIESAEQFFRVIKCARDPSRQSCLLLTR